MLTVLPDNVLGRAGLSELRKHGVDTRAVAFGAGRMGLFFLMPGAVLRPSEVLYDRAGSAFALAPSLCGVEASLADADWFHVSGVTPALGRACADQAIDAAKSARARGVPVSFDGNYRSKLWESWKDQAPAILRQLFENADIVFGDERDIGLVLGRTFEGEDRRVRAAAAAFEAFPRLQRIACTVRMPRSVDAQDYGAVMFTRNGAHQVDAVDLSGIVDRVGTGDAFAAGVIHGLLSGISDAEALAFGHAAACLKHSIPGDFLTLGVSAVRAALAGDGLDVKR
jgi:2-dehydro-3-deoxygluconokinase